MVTERIGGTQPRHDVDVLAQRHERSISGVSSSLTCAAA